LPTDGGHVVDLAHRCSSLQSVVTKYISTTFQMGFKFRKYPQVFLNILYISLRMLVAFSVTRGKLPELIWLFSQAWMVERVTQAIKLQEFLWLFSEAWMAERVAQVGCPRNSADTEFRGIF
jgi:hypothetical protein